MTKKERIRAEWQEYYRRSGQYGRWEYVRRRISFFVSDLKRETQGAEAEEQVILNEIFALLMRVQELASHGAEVYSREKPRKPLGVCPYRLL